MQSSLPQAERVTDLNSIGSATQGVLLVAGLMQDSTVPVMCRRAFSLLEMVAVLVLVVTIAGIGVPTFRAVVSGNEQSAVELAATSVVTELRSEQRLSGRSLTLSEIDAVVGRQSAGSLGPLAGGFLAQFAVGQIRIIYTGSRNDDGFRAGRQVLCIHASAELLSGTIPPGERVNAQTVRDAVWGFEIRDVTTDGVNPWDVPGVGPAPCIT